MTPEAFVFAEAALIDSGRFDDWLALFAEDAHYWIPLLGAKQTDPRSHNSLAYDDHLLLSLRVQRLKGPRVHSQQPRSVCQHVLQQPVIEDRTMTPGSPGEVVRLRTPFLYVESRAGRQIMLSGSACHHLVASDTESGWSIHLKRIDLLEPGRPLPAVQLFI